MLATTELPAIGLLILAMSPTVLAMDMLLPITKDQARDLGLQFGVSRRARSLSG